MWFVKQKGNKDLDQKLKDMKLLEGTTFTIKQGDFEAFKMKIDYIDDQHKKDSQYAKTIIELAGLKTAEEGHYNFTKYIKKKGYDLEKITDAGGRTIVHLAVENNQLEYLKKLFVDHDFTLNMHVIDCMGRTPLHYGAITGNEDMIKIVLAKDFYMRSNLAILGGKDFNYTTVCNALQNSVDPFKAYDAILKPASTTMQRYESVLKDYLNLKEGVAGLTAMQLAYSKDNIKAFKLLKQYNLELRDRGIDCLTQLITGFLVNIYAPKALTYATDKTLDYLLPLEDVRTSTLRETAQTTFALCDKERVLSNA